MSILSAVGVSKTFRIPAVRRDTVREHVLGFLKPRQFQNLKALDTVSFDLKPGETLGVMGRNGSGKSTLLKIICGIYQPDRGRVETRAVITPILELGVGLNPELDAIDNVYLIGSVMGLSLREIRHSMDEILSFAELERFANLKLKQYSTGMSSRLAYAVAFQAVREVLVLDEVFAVGDAGFRKRCEARYEELHARGHAVLLVSHDPRVVRLYCDRALLLDGGRVVMEGSAPIVADQYLAVLTDGRSAIPAAPH
jgi:ABC-type polysaccharide/polyol phosphate transport system ATPase subunit